MIDILLYTRKLEEAGLNRDQAELMVRTQLNMISDNVVTKNDLMAIQNDIKDLEHKFELRFKEIDSRLDGIDHKFASFENRLILKLGAIMVVILGAFTSLNALL